MLIKTHLVFAVLAYLFLFEYIDNKVVFLLALLVATVFVDIDSRNSRIGKHWYLRPLQWIVKHRGIFHTLLFAFGLSFLIYFFSHSAGLGFLLGYVLHLLLDCFTVSGVRLFSPFSRIKIGFFIKTGGLIEQILFVLALLFDVFIIWKSVFN